MIWLPEVVPKAKHLGGLSPSSRSAEYRRIKVPIEIADLSWWNYLPNQEGKFLKKYSVSASDDLSLRLTEIALKRRQLANKLARFIVTEHVLC
jgi:hypothetical protein